MKRCLSTLGITFLGVAVLGVAAPLFLQAADGVFGLCEKGWAYLGLEQFDLAIQQFNDAIQVNAGSGYAYMMRGMVYFLQYKDAGAAGKDSPLLKKSLSDLDTAILLDDTLAVSYQARAAIYELLGEYDSAIADCTKAIELYPALELNPYLELIYGKGEFDRKKEVGQAYYIRGSCYAKMRKLDEALFDMDQAHASDPGKGLYPAEKERIERLRGAIEKLRQVDTAVQEK